MKLLMALVEIHRSILFFFSFSASDPLPRPRATRRSDFRLRESFTHGFQTRDTRPAVIDALSHAKTYYGLRAVLRKRIANLGLVTFLKVKERTR